MTNPATPEETLCANYPGAPLADRTAFQVRRAADGRPRLVPVGRTLRDQAVPLVLAALESLPQGKPVRAVCRQANQIKALSPDLNDHRFMSMDACRRALRRLASSANAA